MNAVSSRWNIFSSGWPSSEPVNNSKGLNDLQQDKAGRWRWFGQKSPSRWLRLYDRRFDLEFQVLLCVSCFLSLFFHDGTDDLGFKPPTKHTVQNTLEDVDKNHIMESFLKPMPLASDPFKKGRLVHQHWWACWDPRSCAEAQTIKYITMNQRYCEILWKSSTQLVFSCGLQFGRTMIKQPRVAWNPAARPEVSKWCDLHDLCLQASRTHWRHRRPAIHWDSKKASGKLT